MPMKECDPAEQNARQEELERLFELDGRAEPSHEFYATYTGLYQKYHGQEAA
ncbi:MAG: hypothetical protein ACO3LT_08520 [Ilumatobacteraceae bacterium]|jgi:hypothetical protein